MTAALQSSPKSSTRGLKEAPSCTRCDWRPSNGGLWPSHGDIACAWIEDNLIFAEGDWFGKPFRLRTDQKLFLWRWYEYCGNCAKWRYRRALRGAAKGDGKTAFIAAIACVEFGGPPPIAPPSPNVPIMAASFEQANLLFSAAATMLGGRDEAVKEAPLCGFFEVYDTEIRFADGRPGRLYRVAAAAGTNDGTLPTTFIADEVHELGEVGSNKARVHLVISNSLAKRATGREINLSTAGFDVDNSLLGDMYKHGKRVEYDPSFDPEFLFDWQEAPEGLDYDQPEHREIAVRAASKAADVLWDVSDRVRRYNAPGVQKHEWIRYYANRWVAIAEDSWLVDHPAAWDNCRGEWESNPDAPFVVSVDMALKRDSVAVSRIEDLADGRYAITSRIWRPDVGQPVDHLDVFNYVRSLAHGGEFRGVVYDPRFFELPGRMLEDEGILVIAFDQSPQRMAPACGLAYDLILEGRVVHDGDPDLASHVKSAVKRIQERGFTLSKGKSKRHIDAAITLCMGLWVLHEVPFGTPWVLVD